MRRRDVLALVAAGTTGLAGCTGAGPAGPGSESPEPTDSPTDSPSDSPTGSPSPSPTETPTPVTVTDREFEVLGVECGSDAESAAVSHDSTGDSTGRVTVRGVVTGNDTCHSARLVGASVTEEHLRVAVESYVPEEDEGKACAECLVDIDYRATIVYEGDGPFDVVVEHGGERVAQSGPYPETGGSSVQYRPGPIR